MITKMDIEEMRADIINRIALIVPEDEQEYSRDTERERYGFINSYLDKGPHDPPEEPEEPEKHPRNVINAIMELDT